MPILHTGMQGEKGQPGPAKGRKQGGQKAETLLRQRENTAENVKLQEKECRICTIWEPFN